MSKSKGPWQDGRRAWERLHGWHQDAPSSVPGHRDDGEDALGALADVGLVRRLLDQAELVAVRTARRHGKSWAEIATRLGVTRQSAWERWRELDEAAPSAPQPASAAPHEVALDIEAAAAVERATASLEAQDKVTADTLEWAMHKHRRSSVVVPNVIGMQWDDARHALQNLALVAVGPDPDGPPLTATGWPHGVVTDQSPESGAKVPAGSTVTLWIDQGGGSGVREPRRPKPAPRAARAMRDEVSDEAVG
jgi:PASTA domain-containing protein